MFLRDEKVETTTGGFLDTNRYSVGDVSKIIGLLIRQYSNPLRAAVRETLANAVDANADAGNPAPVRIYLPSALSAQLRIVDDGVGLSKDAAMHLYTSVGTSTKDQAGNLRIGGFGIGSKAPFAYTRQFTVASRHDGHKATYLCYLDEHNDPHIALTHEEATAERNGVEVSFEVQQTDYGRLRTEVFEIARYFEPVPTVVGSETQPQLPAYVKTGQSWGLRRNGQGARIIMGGVAYPMDAQQLPPDLIDFGKLGFDVTVPINTMKPTPSRESIDYTPDAVAKLTAAFSTIRTELLGEVQKQVDAEPSLWAASRLLATIHLSEDQYLRGYLRNAVRWRGKTVPESFNLPWGSYLEAAWGGSANFYTVGGRKFRSRTLRPKSVEAIYFNDYPEFPRRRLGKLPPNVVVISTPSNYRQGVLDALGNPPFELLSSVPYEKIKPQYTSRGVSAPRRDFFRLRGLAWADMSQGLVALNPARIKPDMYWEPTPPTTPVIYIAMTGYAHDIKNFQAKANLGLITPDEIWVVHSSRVKKLPAGSMSFDQALEQRIRDFIQADPEFARRRFYWNALNDDWAQACRIAKEAKKRTPFAKLKDIHDNVLTGTTAAHRALFNYLPKDAATSNLPAIKEIIADIKDKQPALYAFVNGYITQGEAREDDTALILEKLV